MLSFFSQRKKSASPSVVADNNQKLPSVRKNEIAMSDITVFGAEITSLPDEQNTLSHPQLNNRLKSEYFSTPQISPTELQDAGGEPTELETRHPPVQGRCQEDSALQSQVYYQTSGSAASLPQMGQNLADDTFTDDHVANHVNSEQAGSKIPSQLISQPYISPTLIYENHLMISQEDLGQKMDLQEGRSEDQSAAHDTVILSNQSGSQKQSSKSATETQEPAVRKTTGQLGTNDTTSLPSSHRTRQMSAPPVPPAALSSSARKEYEKPRIPSKYPFAIPPNAPAKVQLLNWLQHWAITVTQIEDAERRHEQNVIIGQRMENTWLEAMRLGLIPRDWQGEGFPESLDVPTTTIEFDKRGRIIQENSRPKRAVSPNREVVIDTRSHRGSRSYGITAGELGEASTSMRAVELRMTDNNLRTDGEELLQDTLDVLGQSMLTEHHWKANLQRTQYNPYGRCLKTYALWEAQRSKNEIEFLNRLLPTFRLAIQIRNTEARIEAEQMLHDQLFALALELNDLEHLGSSSESGSEEDSAEDHNEEDTEAEGPVLFTVGEEKTPRSEKRVEEICPDTDDAEVMTAEQTLETAIDDSSNLGAPSASTEEAHQLPNENVQLQTPTNNNASSYGAISKRPLEPLGDHEEAPPNKRLRTPDRYQLVSNQVYIASDSSPQDLREPTENGRDIAVRVGSDNELAKLETYLIHVIAPKVNSLLCNSGQAAVPKTSSWDEMRIALQKAGVNVAVRNDLVNAINKHIHREVPTKQKDPITDVSDIDGYPTRKQIFNAFPMDGLRFNEIQDHFNNKLMGTDKKWQMLIQSVAHFDKPNQRFYRREELAEELRFSKVVALSTKSLPGYQPEDFSSRIVNNTGGFRWRYLDIASPKQRESMDTVINDHVEGSKMSLTHAQALRKKESWRIPPYDHHGNYEVLVNPRDQRPNKDGGSYHDPIEFEPTPVVHGVWDRKGRKNEDKSVDGMEWFYAGERFEAISGSASAGDASGGVSRLPTGEMVKTFVARMEPTSHGVDIQVRDPEIPGMSAEAQAKGMHLPAHMRPGNRKYYGKGGTKLKLNVGSMVHGTEAMRGGKNKTSSSSQTLASHGSPGSGTRTTTADINAKGGSSVYTNRKTTAMAAKTLSKNSPRTTPRPTSAAKTAGTVMKGKGKGKGRGRGRGRPKKRVEEEENIGARSSRAKVNYAEAYPSWIGEESDDDDDDDLYED